MRIKPVWAVFLLLAHCFSGWGYAQDSADQEFTLGVFAYQPAAVMAPQYQSLADYLNSHISGIHVRVEILSLKEIDQLVLDKEIDFILTNPRHYIVLRHKHHFPGPVATIVKTEFNGQAVQKLGGVMFSLKRNLENLTPNDLYQKRIAIPGKEFMGGYQSQIYELKRQHISIDLNNMVEAGSHGAVVEMVLAGQADVGFVRTEVLESLQAKGVLSISDLHIINQQSISNFPFVVSTRLYPEWPLIAMPHVELKWLRKIVSELYALDQNHPTYHGLNIAGFAPPADYTNVDQITRELRLPPYDESPDFGWKDVWNKNPTISWTMLVLSLIILFLIALLIRRNKLLKQVMHQERISQQRYRILTEFAPVSIYETDQSGACIYVNRNWQETAGMTQDEALGQGWANAIHPEDRERVFENWQKHSQENLPWDYEYRFCSPKGRVRWVVGRAKAIQNLQGKITGYLGCNVDITERKKVEQIQQEQFEQLVTFTETLPDAVFLKDGEGRWLLTNELARSLFDLKNVDWYGKTDQELAQRDLFKEAHELCIISDEAAWKQSKIFIEFEYVQDENGRELTFEVRKMPIFAEDGSRKALVIVGRDITEQVKKKAELQASQERYKTLFENMHSGVAVYQAVDEGQDFTFVEFNQSGENLEHVRREDILNKRVTEVFPGVEPMGLLDVFRRVYHTGEKEYFPFAWYKDEKIEGWRDNYVYKLSTGEIAAIYQDQTARKQAEEQLKLAASVFQHSHDSIFITNAKNEIVDANPACLRLTGYSREELLGQDPGIFSSDQHDALFYQSFWEKLERDGHWIGEIINQKKNGELFTERLRIDTILNEAGALQHYVAVFDDITYLKKHQGELEYAAYYDALTGLPNRLLLRDRMRQALHHAERYQRLLAVCYLDLDEFKPVNDTYGHKAGDLILIEVANRLTDVLRKEDTVARLGGDEFVLLLPDFKNTLELEALVNRILRSVSKPFNLQEAQVMVSASIGIALYPQDQGEEDALLRHADQAMYAAKQLGKNRYSFFDPSEELRAVKTYSLQKGIEYALETNQFCLYYQPKVNMRTGEVVGLEALIRWEHPEKGLILPGEFLPVIEHHHLIVDVGEWVLKQAMTQMRKWQKQGIDLPVSVNISALHLQQPDFVLNLRELLDQFEDVSPHKLELEILETVSLDDMAHAGDVIRQCEMLGISFALDDFGTGYSSMTYLRQLPAKTLKIDQSFIRNLLNAPDDIIITEGILGLCRAFNRTPIAEGVESDQHGALLVSLGCELGQGYGIAVPKPANEIEPWLQTFDLAKSWTNVSWQWNHTLDATIMLTAVEHYRLVERILSMAENGMPAMIPDHLINVESCALGKWIEGEGQKRFGVLPQFRELAEVHNQLHVEIANIIKPMDDWNREERKADITEIRRLYTLVIKLMTELHSP